MNTKLHTLRRAFVEWATQSAIPMPKTSEEPLSNEALSTVQHMLQGKRFMFLGEPDHFVLEKFPFRLTFIRNFFPLGWRHIGMEMGRSMGWRLDQHLEILGTSLPSSPKVKDGYDYKKTFGQVIDFIERHETAFNKQIAAVNKSRPGGTARLHFFGFDFDLGDPLAAIEPLRILLSDYEHDYHIRPLLTALDELNGLEANQQLTEVGKIQSQLFKQREKFIPSFGEKCCRQMESWLRTLHFSVASVQRPRVVQDPSGHRLWRAEREKLMMQQMDDIEADNSPEAKYVLLGHNCHLSKDAGNLSNHPQRNAFWGYRSWLRSLAYALNERITKRPLDTFGGSIGSHVSNRFPGQVLAIWMLYGQGQLMGKNGPMNIRLHGDTIESLLAQVGDRFLLPLDQVAPEARSVLACANFRWAGGYYASADLTAQADALYFVKNVTAELDQEGLAW